MIVVADTGPINYLVLIEEIHLLPQLYKQVFIPRAVAQELTREAAPKPVRRWIAAPPEWLQIVSPSGVPDAGLAGLDSGEASAILLAEELGADEIVIDDAKGRRRAITRGLRATGTLAVLAAANRMGLVDIDAAVARLRTTSFRASEKLLDWTRRR